MKLIDLENVNRLVDGLREIDGLIETAEAAESAMFQLLIEAPGDASLRMSAEGSSTTHARGIGVSAGFLARLKTLAIAELHARRAIALDALAALGVDTGASEPLVLDPP